TPQKELKLDPTQTNPGFMALLKNYKSVVKGVVIWDPNLEEATIEAATTIAGQKDGLIVSPALAEQLKSYNFPVIADLRGLFKNNIECVDWLKTNYFKTANHQIAFTWSHMTTNPENSWGAANKDYVVANRLFTFFLDITKHEECAYYETVVKEYPVGTPVFGWTDEIKADKLFADYGYFMIPYISVENLTIQSSYPSVSGIQPAPKAYPIEKNAVYIAFYVADGDNLLHSMVYKPYTICNTANYGTIPTTWILNPAIVDLAPLVYNWYQKKLGNQEIAGMMGDGAPSSDRYTGYLFYCEWARHYMNQAGFRTMKQMAEAEAVAWRVQPYVMNSGYAGTESRGCGPYEYHMDNQTFHIGSLHISERDQLTKAIDAAPANQPLFLSVFCGTAVGDVPTTIKNMADKLKARNDGKKYYFVRSMDLAATYRVWKGLPIK
ncbi:MAG: GxGYxYP family putative glycoside hydrolase, partial [Bacteroidales bacterium]|nr:GxGYxYP family putative glycoside hydrolase [Bacteroidales bacterium]